MTQPPAPLDESPLRILIAGSGKSGTTALFFRIKNSMPPTTRALFEPQGREPLAMAVEEPGPLVVKVLVPLAADLLAELNTWFPRRVLIMRDWRDVIVSAVLYTSAYTYCWNQPEDRIRSQLRLLMAKEAKAAEISLLSLLSSLWTGFERQDFTAFAQGMMAQLEQVAMPPYDYFVLKYEDLIAGRLAPLESYLGLPLTQDDSVAGEFQRVVRTKGSGGWRDWFTAEDVSFFRPLFSASLARFGYDSDDWRINPDAILAPAHGSSYFLRVLNERRRLGGLPEIEP